MAEGDRSDFETQLRVRREMLRKMLAEDLAASDYATAYQNASAWNQMFKEELAARFQPILNQHLATLPQENLEQMRDIATGTNAQLKQLGLASRCPANGQAASLVAETKSGDERHIFRFRFKTGADHGTPAKRYEAHRTVPELTLMPLPARVEHMSRGYRESIRDRDRGI